MPPPPFPSAHQFDNLSWFPILATNGQTARNMVSPAAHLDSHSPAREFGFSAAVPMIAPTLERCFGHHIFRALHMWSQTGRLISGA